MGSPDRSSPSLACAQLPAATPPSEGVSAASLLALVQTQSAQLALAEQQLNVAQQAHRQAVAALQKAQDQLAHQQHVVQELVQLRQQHQALAAHLHEIQTSTVIRVTRPLVRAKLGLDLALGRRHAAPVLPPAMAVVPAPPASSDVSALPASVQHDPVCPPDQDVARLRASALPRVLAVSHGWGGGTQRHVEELARHLREQAIFLLLSSQDDGPLRLRWLDERESFYQEFHWPSEQAALVTLLRALGVSHVHYHHLVGHAPEVMHLHEHLGVAYDFTAHDYYSACPQISLTTAQKIYCGEQGLAQCRACVRERPAPTEETIDAWQLRHRLLLHQARWVLAPSHDCAQRMRRYFPQARIRYAPHTDMLEHPAAPVRAPLPLPAPRHLRVFLVGGLSAIKGGDVAEAVALEAARLNAPIELHLLGYVFRTFKAQPEASLTIHGTYQEHDLPRLLQRLQPDVVWFPAVWPETYSYTLSTCLQAGLPVVTTDLGAFPERLAQRRWTWVLPWNTSATDWLAFFLRLRQQFIASGDPTDEAGQPCEPSGLPEAPLGRHDEDWNYARDYLQGLAPISVPAAPASAQA